MELTSQKHSQKSIFFENLPKNSLLKIAKFLLDAAQNEIELCKNIAVLNRVDKFFHNLINKDPETANIVLLLTLNKFEKIKQEFFGQYNILYNHLPCQLDTSAPTLLSKTKLLARVKNFETKKNIYAEYCSKKIIKNKCTPERLVKAINAGKAYLVWIAICNGTNVNFKDKSGHTSLMYAIINKHEYLAKMLIENGANINTQNDKNGFTALMYSAKNGLAETTKLLLKNGTDIDAKNIVGVTALMLAAHNGHGEIMQLLIAKGADTKTKNCVKWTPFMTAVIGGHTNLALLLPDKNACFDEKDIWGNDALNYAVELGDIQGVRDLIENGANPNSKDAKDLTPLLKALKMKRYDIAQLLIEKGANVDAKNLIGETPIFEATLWGDIEAVKFLVRNGANVNAKDAYEVRALQIAARDGHKEIAQLLLDNGAYSCDLAIANEYGHHEIAKLYPSKYSSAQSLPSQNQVDIGGWPPLMWAIISKDNHDAKKLINSGTIDINATRHGGWTALMLAARYGNSEMVKILIGNKAAINSSTTSGMTALYLAKKFGHEEVVKLLIESGAFNPETDSLD